MKRMAIAIALLSHLSAAPPAAADETTARGVVDRFVEAVGGRAAVETLRTRVVLGRVIDDLSWKEPRRRITPLGAWSTAGGKLLIATLGRTGIRREWTDGAHAWVQDGPSVERREDIRRKFGWLYDPRGFIRVEEHFPGLRLRGVEQRENRDVYALEPGDELDPLHYTLYFDVATGLLTGIGHYWVLDDWRDAGGVLFPHRIVCSRKGGSTSFVYDGVFHNATLQEGMFASPEIAGPE